MRSFNKKLYTFTSKHVKDLLTYAMPDRARYSKAPETPSNSKPVNGSASTVYGAVIYFSSKKSRSKFFIPQRPINKKTHKNLLSPSSSCKIIFP